MRYLFTLTCLLLATATAADEPEFDFKSNKAKAAVQKYQDASRKSNKRNLDSLIRSLEAAFKHERTDGDLDEAIKIRDAIKALKKGASPTGTSVAGSKGKKKAKKSKTRIPRDAVKWNGHHYWVSREKMTWHLARDYCESLGGHLMRIESKDEHEFARRILSNRGSISHVWVDGTDAYKEGEWRFSNGEPIIYNGWSRGEGKAGNRINQMTLWEKTRWSFADDDGSWRLFFICEWDE